MADCASCSELSSVIDEVITCNGPCNSAVCRSCAGLSKAAVKIVYECKNVHFYCNSCNGVSIKDVAISLVDVNQKLNKLTEYVVANSLKIPAPSMSFLNDVDSGASSLKRRRVDNIASGPRAATPNHIRQSLVQAPLLTGSTATTDLMSVEERKVVVASMLHPTTDVGKLTTFLNKQLKLDKDSSSIRCQLLLPVGRTVEQLDYVSFKISVPEPLYPLLLFAEVWPKGVTLRDFVFRRFNSRPLGSFLPMTNPIIPDSPLAMN